METLYGTNSWGSTGGGNGVPSPLKKIPAHAHTQMTTDCVTLEVHLSKKNSFHWQDNYNTAIQLGSEYQTRENFEANRSNQIILVCFHGSNQNDSEMARLIQIILL